MRSIIIFDKVARIGDFTISANDSVGKVVYDIIHYDESGVSNVHMGLSYSSAVHKVGMPFMESRMSPEDISSFIDSIRSGYLPFDIWGSMTIDDFIENAVAANQPFMLSEVADGDGIAVIISYKQNEIMSYNVDSPNKFLRDIRPDMLYSLLSLSASVYGLDMRCCSISRCVDVL